MTDRSDAHAPRTRSPRRRSRSRTRSPRRRPRRDSSSPRRRRRDSRSRSTSAVRRRRGEASRERRDRSGSRRRSGSGGNNRKTIADGGSSAKAITVRSRSPVDVKNANRVPLGARRRSRSGSAERNGQRRPDRSPSPGARNANRVALGGRRRSRSGSRQRDIKPIVKAPPPPPIRMPRGLMNNPSNANTEPLGVRRRSTSRGATNGQSDLLAPPPPAKAPFMPSLSARGSGTGNANTEPLGVRRFSRSPSSDSDSRRRQATARQIKAETPDKVSSSKAARPGIRPRHRSRSRSASGERNGRDRNDVKATSFKDDRDEKPVMTDESRAFQNRRTEREQQNEYSVWRRTQREEIGASGRTNLWARSPSPSHLKLLEAAEKKKKKKKKHKKKAAGDESGDEEDEKKKKKKRKKSKKKKEKKEKKTKKQRRTGSEEEASTSGEEEWVEVTRETIDRAVEEKQTEDDNMIGPRLPNTEHDDDGTGGDKLTDYGKDLLKGEGARMAAYIAEGKRIPRRGEIGLSSDDIKIYENVGYVMSGARHHRMEATRLRKENQVYSAEEKRMLGTFSKEERDKKEAAILAQFKQLVRSKTDQP